MSVHAIRRRCILCASPMLGIAKRPEADVCLICGLSAEEQRRAETEDAFAGIDQPPPKRKKRAVLRSV